MTYPLFAGSPSEVDVPPMIGADIEFLLDTPSGFVTKNIGEIAEMIESDLYDDEPSTLDESKVYMLSRHAYPRQVAVQYRVIKTVRNKIIPSYHLKVVQLVDIDGGVMAQADYRVYEPSSNK